MLGKRRGRMSARCFSGGPDYQRVLMSHALRQRQDASHGITNGLVNDRRDDWPQHDHLASQRHCRLQWSFHLEALWHFGAAIVGTIASSVAARSSSLHCLLSGDGGCSMLAHSVRIFSAALSFKEL